MPFLNATSVHPIISVVLVMETSLSLRITSHAMPAISLIAWGAPITTSVGNVLKDTHSIITEEEAVVMSVMSIIATPAWDPINARSATSDTS